MTRPSQPARFPTSRIFPCLALACALVSSASAEGVAIIKKHPFHDDDMAYAIPYRTIRRGGPWIRLTTRSRVIDIRISKLATWIDFPDPIPPNVTNDEDISRYRQTLDIMRQYAAKYPKSAPFLRTQIQLLSNHVRRFDNGEIRFEGKWMTRNHWRRLLESREQIARERRKREIEQVVREARNREAGMTLVNGSWVPAETSTDTSPTDPTPLSEAVAALDEYPNQAGAAIAIDNLSKLAARQKGAAKVRTQRLLSLLRNLFLADYRLVHQITASRLLTAKAREHEHTAAEWRKPNAFGTDRSNQADLSLSKARQLRESAESLLRQRRSELLDQLREGDVLTADFHQLGEHRVALSLAGTIRAIAARRFPDGSFSSRFPDETLKTIRSEIRNAK